MRTLCALAAIALVAASAHAEDDPETARLDQEAKGVFVTVLKEMAVGKLFPVGTCTFEPDWSRVGLDYDRAHRALGLEVHANLQNPDEVASPSDIFGAGVPKDAFCDDAARTRYVEVRVAAWQAEFKALPKDAKPPRGIATLTRSFSFPFFDRDFQRAVVIWDEAYHFVEFDAKGERCLAPNQDVRCLWMMGEGIGRAVVYQRDAAGWRRTGSDVVYRAH